MLLLLWLSAAASGWLVALHLRAELGRRAALTARACHEVRGPLTAAGLAVGSALRRGGGAPGVLRAVEVELRRAAVAIEDLVDDLDRRRSAPDAEELVDVGELLVGQLPAWRAVAGEVDVRGPLPPALVEADPVRLAQALGNLVTNAAEHGDGPVELRVRAAGERVFVEVADDGPGLPAPVATLVRREGAGRHGHGLAVAADVARRCGGRLSAAPSSGGARLVLELPAASLDAEVEGWIDEEDGR